MSGLRGDFADLAQLRGQFARASGPAHRLEMSKVLAEEARTQVLFGFVRGVDPYDKPWKPLRSREGQILRDTGRLQNGVAGYPHVTERGFTISTNLKYAPTHQYGAVIRAKNPSFRSGGAGSDGMDMVSAGEPMLRFRVGGARPHKNGRWVSKRQVTIPQRQFMPEGTVGPRWGGALESAADLVVQRRFGGP